MRCTNSSNIADSWRRTVYSELLHQSGVMSSPLLCQPWTGLVFSASIGHLSFLSLSSIFPVGLAGGQQSAAKQQRPGSPYSGCVETDCMMKMLDSAAFYTLSGNSPAVFLVYLWHSYYIPRTFEMHSTYSSCIMSEFLDVRTVFGSHSMNILTAFIQQSRHLPAAIIQAAIDLQSYGIWLAIWTFWQHSKYSYWVYFYWIPTTFELHSRANNSECARIIPCGFEANSEYSNGTAFLKNIFMMILPKCGLNVTVWFRLIRFLCDVAYKTHRNVVTDYADVHQSRQAQRDSA